jgi:O-antigen/teichoic acid export membrane protein
MKLIRSLSLYAVSSLLSRAVPFFLLPIMTAYLTPAEYGTVAVVVVLTSLVSSPLLIGIVSYINIEYFSLSEKSHKELISTLILIPFILFLPISLLFYIYSIMDLEVWSIPKIWFLSIPLLALTTFFYRILTVLFRIREEPIFYGLIEVFYSILQVGLAILFVVYLSEGLEGRLWAVLASSVIVSLLSLAVLYRQGYITAGFHLHFIKDSIKYGLGIVPHELSGQLIRMVDRLFIVVFLGTSAAGLYAVSAQVASIGLVILSVFNLAWQPYVFKCLSNENISTKIHLVRLSWLVLVGFVLIFVLLNFSAPVIYQYFIADAYSASLFYVKWLLLGFFFQAVYTIFCDYIFYVKKTYLLSITTLGTLLLTLLLNYLFIPKYGAIGSAYAFAISSGVSSIVVIMISTYVFSMPWLRFRNV